MNRQYESMTRFVVAGLTIRVWCEEREFRAGPNQEVLRRLKDGLPSDAHLRALGATDRVYLISRELDALPNVSAYEILDEQGHGAIIYPDWK
jgi:hypothetical protein